MDALVEVILEIVFELFGEIIIEFFGAIVSNFADYIHVNSRAKKILKYTISGVFFYGCLVLLILSLIYKKALYVEIVIIYFIILLITYILKFLNKNVFKNQSFGTVITWGTRIIHYIFPVVLIVVAALNKNKATPVIITLSSIALFVYLCINIYRFTYYNKLKKYHFFHTKLLKMLNKYREDKSVFKRRKIERYILRDLDFTGRFLQECKEEDFRVFCDLFKQEPFVLQLNKKGNIEEILTIMERKVEEFSILEMEENIEVIREKYSVKKKNFDFNG